MKPRMTCGHCGKSIQARYLQYLTVGDDVVCSECGEKTVIERQPLPAPGPVGLLRFFGWLNLVLGVLGALGAAMWTDDLSVAIALGSLVGGVSLCVLFLGMASVTSSLHIALTHLWGVHTFLLRHYIGQEDASRDDGASM
jgi:DNA-directed RNA polymerase subunit RPC12/RpoP